MNAGRVLLWITKTRCARIVFVTLLGLAAPDLRAQSSGLPAPLPDVAFEQKLGAQVPLDATFRDESGASVSLGQYFRGKPVILALVYYECPMLCTMVLNGLESSLRVLQFDVGREFDVLTVSFDTRDTPRLAAEKRANHLRNYGRPGASEGWHFLVGDEPSIRRLTDAVGFRYAWVPETKQFAHASGIVVLTPDGQVSRYFYGIEYSSKDLRLGLVEAGNRKIGNLIDQALLFCFQYDPASGKYGAVILNVVRLSAAVTVLLIVAYIGWNRRRERRRQTTARTA